MIERAIDEALPFECVSFDTLYGRSTELSAQVRAAGKSYLAEVPVDTWVYREHPALGIPEPTARRGRKPSKIQVLEGEAICVDSLREVVPWQEMLVRPTEWGELYDKRINAEGTTVLLVEQNAYMALQIAHHAYVLEIGMIVLSGPAAELQADPKLDFTHF